MFYCTGQAVRCKHTRGCAPYWLCRSKCKNVTSTCSSSIICKCLQEFFRKNSKLVFFFFPPMLYSGKSRCCKAIHFSGRVFYKSVLPVLGGCWQCSCFRSLYRNMTMLAMQVTTNNRRLDCLHFFFFSFQKRLRDAIKTSLV